MRTVKVPSGTPRAVKRPSLPACTVHRAAIAGRAAARRSRRRRASSRRSGDQTGDGAARLHLDVDIRGLVGQHLAVGGAIKRERSGAGLQRYGERTGQHLRQRECAVGLGLHGEGVGEAAVAGDGDVARCRCAARVERVSADGADAVQQQRDVGGLRSDNVGYAGGLVDAAEDFRVERGESGGNALERERARHVCGRFELGAAGAARA